MPKKRKLEKKKDALGQKLVRYEGDENWQLEGEQ